MAEEKKEYDNEMRGSVWMDDKRTNEKAPIATGTVTVSGVELRLAMWGKRVAKVNGMDRTYWLVALEYKQGARRFLVPVEPKNVVATGASADAAAPGTEPETPGSPDDMPF